MLLMVLLFYWAKRQEASCNMQKPNTGVKMLDGKNPKNSNNAIRISTKSRGYWLAASNTNTCPKPDFSSEVLSECVLEVTAVLHGRLDSRKTRNPTYSPASQNRALFLYRAGHVFFINIKWTQPHWTLILLQSMVPFWKALAWFWSI